MIRLTSIAPTFVRPSICDRRSKLTIDVVVVVLGDRDLPEVVEALQSPGGLAGGLHAGQQNGN
jgi:hypothetical protein